MLKASGAACGEVERRRTSEKKNENSMKKTSHVFVPHQVWGERFKIC